MQPQMPYGGTPSPGQEPQGPQVPQGQPSGPLQPQIPGQPGMHTPFDPNQFTQPAQPQNPGQPGQYNQPGQQAPQYPGQPPMPQYQPPAGYNHHPGNPVPLPPPPPRQKTPYDFFMQQKHPVNTKLPIPGPRQAGFGGKLGWIIGGGVALILIIGIVSSLIPKDTTLRDLVTVAQTQQEVVRVCNMGFVAKQAPNRNFAANCTLGVSSDQQKLIAYLAKNKVKVNEKTIGALANAKNDQELKSATAASNFDDTFKTVAERQLTAYNSAIQQQLAQPSLGPKAQEILGVALTNSKLLLEQIQGPAAATTTTP